MNPYIWKKEMLDGKMKDSAGGSWYETKGKKCIFHLVREWWPLKTQCKHSKPNKQSKHKEKENWK